MPAESLSLTVPQPARVEASRATAAIESGRVRMDIFWVVPDRAWRLSTGWRQRQTIALNQ